MPQIPRKPVARISSHTLCDNGHVASSSLARLTVEKLNAAARWRRKEVFRYAGPTAALTSVGGYRRRWNFAFHTGRYARRLVIRAVMARVKTFIGNSENPYMRFTIDGGQSIGESYVTYNYGGPQGSPIDSPAEFAYPRLTLDVYPDMDYTATFNDFNGSRLVSACVHEESIQATDGVYVDRRAGVAVPIYSANREQVLPMMDDLWKSNGAHCFNFTCDSDTSGDLRTSSTPDVFTNLVDNTSTTVTAATPGFTLDLRYKNRRSQTTVPCIFRAFAKVNSETGLGKVILYDSAGDTVARINVLASPLLYSTVAPDSPFWWSVVVNMPATRAKYDVRYGHEADGGASVTVYAVSLYEYDGPVPVLPPELSPDASTFARQPRIPRYIRRAERRGGNR